MKGLSTSFDKKKNNATTKGKIETGETIGGSGKNRAGKTA